MHLNYFSVKLGKKKNSLLTKTAWHVVWHLQNFDRVQSYLIEMLTSYVTMSLPVSEPQSPCLCNRYSDSTYWMGLWEEVSHLLQQEHFVKQLSLRKCEPLLVLVHSDLDGGRDYAQTLFFILPL